MELTIVHKYGTRTLHRTDEPPPLILGNGESVIPVGSVTVCGQDINGIDVAHQQPLPTRWSKWRRCQPCLAGLELEFAYVRTRKGTPWSTR